MYEEEFADGVTTEKIKLIGIYSSHKKAKKIIEKLKHVQGFNRFSEDDFYIDEYTLNDTHWNEGFVTWDGEAETWIE